MTTAISSNSEDLRQQLGLGSSSTVNFSGVNVTASTIPTNGMYLPAANSVGIASNSVERIRIDSSGNVDGAKFRVTVEGGYAIKLVAGENLSAGEIVYVKQTSGADGKVWKAPTSSDMPIGVVYASASADAYVWVVVSGIAYVLPESGVTATRGYVIITSTSETGRVAQSATAPSTVEHFRECGHFLDTGSGNGALTRAVLHFN